MIGKGAFDHVGKFAFFVMFNKMRGGARVRHPRHQTRNIGAALLWNGPNEVEASIAIGD